MYLLGKHIFIEGFLAIFAHKANQPFIHRLGKLHGLITGEYIGFLNLFINLSCGFVRHLASVTAVGLIAVVLCRVVGSGQHNTRTAMIVSGSKGQSRHRHQSIIHPNGNAICRQNLRRFLGKGPALQTGVIADGYQLLQLLL